MPSAKATLSLIMTFFRDPVGVGDTIVVDASAKLGLGKRKKSQSTVLLKQGGWHTLQ
jgi:hypothetical protein